MRISDWSSDVCSSDLPDNSPDPWLCIGIDTARNRPRLLQDNGGYLARKSASFSCRSQSKTKEGMLVSPRKTQYIQQCIRCYWMPREDSNLDRRSEEHTSELQSLMRLSYAVFCLKTKMHTIQHDSPSTQLLII